MDKIAFIGAGNMAKAIITGLINAGYAKENIIAVNRSFDKNAALAQEFAIQTSLNATEAVKAADILVLGVKPQNMAELLASLQHLDWSEKLVISLAAGITTTRLQQMANNRLKLIRVMPNTPSLIGEGMAGLYANNDISQSEKDIAEYLLGAVGNICWLESENEINGIIAVAGSAPAYFFLFMEAMQQQAQKQGFSEQQARILVQQTAIGAAKLAEAKSDISFTELREQVTSKGGTTAEAIKVFEQANLSTIVATAMQAAVQRAEEMESLF